MRSRTHLTQPPDVARSMVDIHGELVGGTSLQHCLGFRSARSFQRALQAGNLPVETFLLPGRRGRFARTRDVALWLATLGRESGEP